MRRILLVDDHLAVRAGLKALLLTEFPELHIELAENEAVALALMGKEICHVVILDVNLPGRGGLELIRVLKGSQPHVKVLIYTMHSERQFGLPAFRAGADGFLTKDSSPSALFEAIRLLLSGRKYLSNSLAEQLASALTGEAGASLHEKLSPRERTVFERLLEGCAPSQIASDLGMNIRTVSTYRARIYEKLKLSNHSELMLYAVQHGLIRQSLGHVSGC